MWKNILGYENLYMINEYRDIFSLKSNQYIKPYISNKGYKLIDLSKNGVRRKYSIHKLVAIHFVPNPNNFPIVLHKDNIKTNTYYENLIWGTYSENNSQTIKDGLNKVPKPDNRKHYLLSNGSDNIICYGVSKVTNIINYNTDSSTRNLVHRHSVINNGPYTGYTVSRIDPICPIIFDK